MLNMAEKRGNKGKLLYVCRECGARKYVKTIYSNRRGGTHCMDCGGVLDPDSNNAIIKSQLTADRLNGDTTGSLILHSKKKR